MCYRLIMCSESGITLQTNYNIKGFVEEEVIKTLQKEEYNLNTVNSNGDNLLHISAANGCLKIIKEILRKQNSYTVIDRKNKFGWTPLMLAIRNRHIETVKFLLEKGANVNEYTYLGMSVLGLSAAINMNMFKTVYEACPSGLLNCTNDDITPLCIAAMKNDKSLFFKLLELGFETSQSNEYTQIMMKQSTVSEIVNLSKKHLDIEDYWNDTTDNIPVEIESNEKRHFLKLINESEKNVIDNIKSKYLKENENNDKLSPLDLPMKPVFVFHSPEVKSDDCNNNNIIIDSKKSSKYKLNVMIEHSNSTQHSLISPLLTCTASEMSLASPNIYFEQNNHDNKVNVDVTNNMEKAQLIQDETEVVSEYSKNNNCLSELPLQRLQFIRPPDLNLKNDQEDPNITLGCITEFSPIRSPHVPLDINDENVFGGNTPTPPHYKTPPKGRVFYSEEARMFVLLKRYGLNQHVPIFLEQEVDIDLFMTLTNEDLIEIGIKDESDRKAILNVIRIINTH